MGVGKLLGPSLSVGILQVLGFVRNLTGWGFIVGTLTFPRIFSAVDSVGFGHPTLRTMPSDHPVHQTKHVFGSLLVRQLISTSCALRFHRKMWWAKELSRLQHLNRPRIPPVANSLQAQKQKPIMPIYGKKLFYTLRLLNCHLLAKGYFLYLTRIFDTNDRMCNNSIPKECFNTAQK